MPNTPPPPPTTTNFLTVTYKNVGLTPKKFLTFSFDPFFHTSVKFQVRTYCQSEIIELEPRPPFKKSRFSGQILIKLRL